jgi:hypothetical protein
VQNFTGLQSGQTEEFQDFSGANGTGTLLDRGFDFSSGGSQVEFFNQTALPTKPKISLVLI